MGRTREEEQVRELLKEYGTYVRKTNHGDLWALPGERTMVTYSEERKGNVDWRAWKNALADLKRLLRNAGIELNGSTQGAVIQPEPADQEEEDVLDLEALGVHVEKKVKKTIMRREIVEVTISGTALAQLLQVVDSDGLQSVGIVDDNGETIDRDATDCHLLRFVRETIEEEEEG
jgi:hypothetical protein